MAKKLHARPNLEHLTEHVGALRALEGEWTFTSLEIDGASIDAPSFATSRLLMDSDRFRMASEGLDYDGVFTIDVEVMPHTIDINLVEGPEAGNTALGIFDLQGDQLTICLGLVGSSRPAAFATTKGSGHALERLRRASHQRPAGVTGGTKPMAAAAHAPMPAAMIDPKSFDTAMTPPLTKMEGEWAPTRLVRDGEPMDDQWLSYGSRIGTGNEVRVAFGGQTMVHAKIRVDERATPSAIDYLGLSGASKGKISLGVAEWVKDELRVNMALPGQPRPVDFTCAAGSGRTLSQWRRR